MSLQVIDLENPLWLEILQKLRHDVYHLPEYMALEASRSKAVPKAILIVDNENIFFLPYLLRQGDAIVDGLLTQKVDDVVSPNGYAGILLSEAANMPEFIKFAMNQLIQVFQKNNVCSAFFRLHPILNHDFNIIFKSDICHVNGETVSIDLRLSESEIWHQTRPEHPNKINKCKRNGLIVKIVQYYRYIDQFVEIYEETMDRVGAANFFYFEREYFLQMGNALSEKIHLCIVELEEQAICGGLFTECCGIVQYHFGGTRPSF